MAKLSYLELTNRILRRITQQEITDVTLASGHGKRVTNFINEAQNVIFTEPVNWYSLFKMRTFSLTSYTASTISFANANPDTIDDSASGFGDFESGTQVYVSGTTSNDDIYRVDTAAAGTLTLQTADTLTVEAASESITITPVTKLAATDFGRSLDLMDVTNGQVINEGYDRFMDEADPDMNNTGTPRDFIYQDGGLRFYPIPSGTVKMRERYWKIPDTLSANANTSDLPIECEQAIIYWVWGEMLQYLNSFEKADRIFQKYALLIEKAKMANDRQISRMHVFEANTNRRGVHPPMLPVEYGGYY